MVDGVVVDRLGEMGREFRSGINISVYGDDSEGFRCLFSRRDPIERSPGRSFTFENGETLLQA